MPQGSSDRVTFEGARTTARTVAMLKEARKIFTARTGHKAPRISQGGYNRGGVAASSGTHDRDAMDFAVSGWPRSQQEAWEDAEWAVGFAAWWRRFLWNVWPEHNHAIPKGGDLAPAAKNQEKAFENHRDGLARNGPYPRIGKYSYVTWEKYLASKKAKQKIKISAHWYPDIKVISVYWLAQAWQGNYVSRHVFYVQRWLDELGFYSEPHDGIAGPKTEAAYDQFRRSIGMTGHDAVGTPGLASLRALAKKAKTTRLIKEGK